MTNVLCLNLPKVNGVAIQRDEKTYGESELITNPYDIALTAAALEKAKVNVELFDVAALDYSPQETVDLVKSKNPDFLFVTSTFASYKQDMDILNLCRPFAKTIICAFNPALTQSLAHKFLKLNPYVDYLVLDEMYFTVPNFIMKKDDKGLAYLKKGKIIFHKKQFYEYGNVNDLPIPAYQMLPMEKYSSIYFIPSKDCPFACKFCTHAKKKARLRSANNVLAELELLYKVYQKTNFHISEPIFTIDKQRAIDICKGIIDQGLKIDWFCESRFNTIDEEICTWLKKAGCIGVEFGLESGSQEILNAMNKRFDLVAAKKTVDFVKKAGLNVNFFIIIGFPGENHESLKATTDVLNELKPDSFFINIATPFPNTDFYAELINKKIISEDDYFTQNFSHRSTQFLNKITDIDMVFERQRIMNSVRATSWYFKNKLKQIWRRPQDIPRLTKKGFQLLGKVLSRAN